MKIIIAGDGKVGAALTRQFTSEGHDVTVIDYNSVILDSSVERSCLRTAIRGLSSRERNIVELRYGIGGGSERTQKEVADMLGISQSYISRLEKRIIGKLRVEMEKMA